MDDFLKMDIFFVVTTIVVLFAGILVVVALYYVVRIFKSIDHLARNVSEESDNVRNDLVMMRAKIRDEGMKVKHFLDFFAGMKGRKSQRKKSSAEE